MLKTMCHEIGSEMFFYSGSTKTFVGDASSLPRWFDPMRRVWGDACDAGFVLVSEKTGAKVVFTFNHADLNDEGETVGWYFKAEPLINPKIVDTEYTLLIINT